MGIYLMKKTQYGDQAEERVYRQRTVGNVLKNTRKMAG
jgi:hypothetical protein